MSESRMIRDALRTDDGLQECLSRAVALTGDTGFDDLSASYDVCLKHLEHVFRDYVKGLVVDPLQYIPAKAWVQEARKDWLDDRLRVVDWGMIARYYMPRNFYYTVVEHLNGSVDGQHQVGCGADQDNGWGA